MNKVILYGRLTKDVDTRYTQGGKPMCVARFSLAVDRKYKKDGEQTADFINCVAFDKLGEIATKYLQKGTGVVASGHIQTGNYTNKDGQKVYTTDIVVDELKAVSKLKTAEQEQTDGFTSVTDDELPFN